MLSRCGTEGRGKERACIGLPDAFALKRIQDNHSPSPSASIAGGKDSGGLVQGRRECQPVVCNMAIGSGHPRPDLLGKYNINVR